MDSLITAAARALAAGNLLGVLKRVGVRDDALALALRGIAMAQRDAFGPTWRAAFARAECAARQAFIPAVMAEVESASLVLNKAAACPIARGEERLLLFEEVEAVLESGTLVVDACRTRGISANPNTNPPAIPVQGNRGI
jgi:hypothetical protein